MWRREFVELLRNEYVQARKKNPKFSMRAYALKLGISSGSLSSLFNQSVTWNISVSRAKAILDRMNLHPSKHNQMLIRMNENPLKRSNELQVSDGALLTDWAYLPVLMCFSLPHPLNTAESIAERLGLSVSKVNEVIADLVQQQLLIKSEDQIQNRDHETWILSDNLPKELVEAYRHQNFEMLGRALKSLPASDLEFQSITFTGNRAQMTELKREIQALLNRVSHLLDDGPDNTDVFRMTAMLFPINFKKTTV